MQDIRGAQQRTTRSKRLYVTSTGKKEIFLLFLICSTFFMFWTASLGRGSAWRRASIDGPEGVGAVYIQVYLLTKYRKRVWAWAVLPEESRLAVFVQWIFGWLKCSFGLIYSKGEPLQSGKLDATFKQSFTFLEGDMLDIC